MYYKVDWSEQETHLKEGDKIQWLPFKLCPVDQLHKTHTNKKTRQLPTIKRILHFD